MRRVLILSLALCLPGCMLLGPNFFRPKTQVPAEYKEMKGWKTAQPRDQEIRGNWWEMYNDPVLNDLQSQVNVSNQNIAQAEARYRQARALSAQARASYFPVVGVSAATTRAQQAGAARLAVDSNNIGLDASWEPDFFGRVRRTVESARASERASAADVEVMRLSVHADLATNYFLLRSLDAGQKILEDTVGAYQATLKLTQNRYDAGVAARSDIVQAEAQMKATQAQAIDVGVQRAQLEHAIAVLIGKPPSELSLPRAPLMDVAPPAIPVGLPSELLERRPDIAAAERRVESANAQIGVAKAAYFPTITLSASGGLQSSAIGDLLGSSARFWSLGAALAQTIFDAGLRRGRVQQAEAVYDETVGAYRQTVLTGFQEVEDNLAALRILEQEAVVQAGALESSRRAVELTVNQYKAGIVSYLNVLTAQTTALANERTALDIRNRRLAASVLLVRALGGGWNPAASSQQAGNKP